MSAPLPSVAQLVRFRKRTAKAYEALEAASYYLLEALRTFDGDKIPTKHDSAMAWEDAHATEAAIDALKALLSTAETYADDALKAARRAASPPPGRVTGERETR